MKIDRHVSEDLLRSMIALIDICHFLLTKISYTPNKDLEDR